MSTMQEEKIQGIEKDVDILSRLWVFFFLVNFFEDFEQSTFFGAWASEFYDAKLVCQSVSPLKHRKFLLESKAKQSF